ncbi:MAG: heavy metal-associated domain-containing protein [Candidatus Dojkabacteria bacterium]|nr:MAG: heavy metal-associated domain-containing protein [Candidatus Dojkabacteria bacterium]
MATYLIEGMHCESCAKLIGMELEDRELLGCTVDLGNSTITVPESLANLMDDIAEAISAAGEYSLGDKIN